MEKIIKDIDFDCNSCPDCKSSWIGVSIMDSILITQQESILKKSKIEVQQYIEEFFNPPFFFRREILLKNLFEDYHEKDFYHYQCPDCEFVFKRTKN